MRLIEMDFVHFLDVHMIKNSKQSMLDIFFCSYLYPPQDLISHMSQIYVLHILLDVID